MFPTWVLSALNAEQTLKSSLSSQPRETTELTERSSAETVTEISARAFPTAEISADETDTNGQAPPWLSRGGVLLSNKLNMLQS